MKKWTNVRWMLVCTLLACSGGTITRADENESEEDDELKPSWPLPQSRCVHDFQCMEGLVCDVLDISAMPPVEIHGGSPRDGDTVCQPGCRIDGAFYYPDVRDDYPNNCQSCQPGVSTTAWAAVTTNLECRAAAGVCDVADVCDGATGSCPSDTKREATHACRAATGDCDVTDYCDGTTDDCPADEKHAASHACRDAAGACDLTDYCDGTTNDCTADLKSTAECRAAAGDCDAAEFCDGAADDCPSDIKLGTDFECRAAAGDCDLADSCDGLSNDCPDAKRPANEECRAAAGDCDLADSCDGMTNDCPDARRDTNYECRAAAFPCDAAEFCDGGITCPVADDSPCADGALCDADEQCQSGACINGTCGPAAAVNGVCDSGPDCQGELICDGQACKVDRDGACAGNECAGGLACDGTSSTCKVASGGTCVASSDCANGSTCDGDPPTCGSSLNGTCFRSADCGSGLICACDNFKTFLCIPPAECEEDRCDTAGVCKVPVGGICESHGDCGIQRSIDLGEEFYCPSGTCVQKLPLGTVCQADPPGESCDPTCDNVVPPSPNDDACASGTCFLAVGSGGAPYTDPADFVCCSDLGEACVVDEDCCLETRRRQRICSNNVCVRVAIAGEPCQTTSDCDDFAQGAPTGLECNANNICEVPPPEPGDLPNGSACSVAGDCMSLHCAETRDDGFKCLPANEPGSASAGFGEACDGDGFLLRGDPNGRQCTDEGGEMVCCAGGQLAASGQEGRCRQCCRSWDNEDPIGCGPAPGPNSIEVKKCVGQNGPTIQTCASTSDCPESQECIVVDDPRCCGGRCTNILQDPENCGECGNDCIGIADSNPCLVFESCGGGTTPGVCDLTVPCEGEVGMGLGCYDSREDDCATEGCSHFWPLTQEWRDCVAELDDCWETPGEPVCYTYEIDSPTACESCNDNDDCLFNEICRSRCGGASRQDELICFDGSYCAENANDCNE